MMKSPALVAVFLMSMIFSLFQSLAGDEYAEKVDDEFIRYISPPREKVFDSDGNIDLAPLNNRQIRRAATCKLPSSIEDAQLDCKLYPSRVSCRQTCIFGHTLSDGIQREMRCKYDEDKWSPSSKFEKCKPFVDCTLTIGPGGKYRCYSNYLEKGTNCEVSCEHYEDKPAVETANYECDINGNWTPKLPFCAKAGTGLKLTAPPRGPKQISQTDEAKMVL